MTRLTAGMSSVLAVLALVLGLATNASATIKCYDQADLDAAGAGATVVWGDDADEDEIVLEETMFVRAGQTLVIEPGTVIRGQTREDGDADAASAPGSLIVTQNGKIHAVGSPSAPIIFTTAALDEEDETDPVPVAGSDNNPDKSSTVVGSEGNKYYKRFDCSTDPPPAQTLYDGDPLNSVRPPLAASGRHNTQLWGGLVVLGNAPTNLDASCLDGGRAGFGKCFIEGLAGLAFADADRTYGGQYPHDNSGRIEYVQIRHGGDEIGVANEINGLTLGGVGDATVVRYVEVYSNFDDGFEWFGGTVNTDHLVSTFNGDDQFDVDQGHTGTHQSLYAVLPHFEATQEDPRQASFEFGSASGDRACECDGDDIGSGVEGSGDLIGGLVAFDGVALAFSDSAPHDPTMGDDDNYPARAHFTTFYNLTSLSHDVAGQDFTPTAGTNGELKLRNGFGGAFFNSIIYGVGSEDPIQCDGSRYDGYNCEDNAAKTSIPGRTPVARIVSSVFSECDQDMTTGNADVLLDNGDAMGPSSAYHNIADCSGGSRTAGGTTFAGFVQPDITIDVDGSGETPAYYLGSDGKASGPIDPRPSGTGGYLNGQDTGPDPSVDYRGAFEIGEDLWTDGWTTLSISGLQ